MNSRHSADPAPHTVELDWLLEIGALATLTQGLPQLQNRSERLAQILGAAVHHLDCALGALLVPDRHLRLVQVSPAGDSLTDRSVALASRSVAQRVNTRPA